MSYYQQRLVKKIKRVIAEKVQSFIEEEIGEDVLVNIIEVKIDKDLEQARVYFNVYPLEKREKVGEIFQENKKYFRYVLGQSIRSFRVPKVKFILVKG